MRERGESGWRRSRPSRGRRSKFGWWRACCIVEEARGVFLRGLKWEPIEPVGCGNGRVKAGNAKMGRIPALLELGICISSRRAGNKSALEISEAVCASLGQPSFGRGAETPKEGARGALTGRGGRKQLSAGRGAWE